MDENYTMKPVMVVSVLVLKNGKALLNFRKGSFASEMFGTPGGKLENMETFQQCADREAMEEAGITIGPVQFVCLLNNFAHAPHHFINLCVVANWAAGEPQVLEPEKCASWGWYDLDNPPSPLTEVTDCLIKAYKNGGNYFDAMPIK